MNNQPHLDKGCPGKEYFQRKGEEEKEQIRDLFTEMLGDVPKHMKMAGENRIWLVWLSAGVVVIGSLLIAHLT